MAGPRRCALVLGVLLLAAAASAENRSFTLTAHQFTFDVSPMPFEVDVGDRVTLTITASDDGDGGSGHGFSMQTYADTTSHTLHPGSPVTITFTAHTPGTFIYFCTRVCGTGHDGMQGVFTVNGELGPAITEVTPDVAPTSGGAEMTIRGTGFETGATVTIGGLPAINVQVVSSTRIQAVIPAGPFDISLPLQVNLVVANPDGKTAQKKFTWIVPAPAIGTITPASGPRAGGTPVTITGAGFSTAVGLALTFGGVPANDVTIVDAVTLTANTPAHAPGTVDVRITTNKGTVTAASAFTFRAPSRRRAVRK
jgi:plastocyanin